MKRFLNTLNRFSNAVSTPGLDYSNSRVAVNNAPEGFMADLANFVTSEENDAKYAEFMAGANSYADSLQPTAPVEAPKAPEMTEATIAEYRRKTYS